MSPFVHLHVHSEYSLRESTLRIHDLVAKAASLGMPAVAVTDSSALYGAVTFYREAHKVGIKPLLGVQLAVARKTLEEVQGGVAFRGKGADLPDLDGAVLLAENFTGYQNLVRLVTLAQTRHEPHVNFSELALHRQGVLALVAGGESLILSAFANGQRETAERWLRAWQEHVGSERLYIDVQEHALSHERQGLPALVRWARSQKIPLVATNDVHYLEREDADLQRVLARLDSHNNSNLLQGDRYEFASPEEMQRRFAKLPEALANTLILAERCNVDLPLGQVLLPKYPVSAGESAHEVLVRAAWAGARQRYGELTKQVAERLEYELKVIGKMNFADYFLVVADYVRFAHKHQISVGPGRGSAAGSLVAYSLRVTDIDPLEQKLLFERFLNPERVNWPDIDIDFEFERREEVIQYVAQRYGVNHVAQIGTFGTLAARAALRDAGRVLQVQPDIVDTLARLIPPGPGVTLAEALARVPEIAKRLADGGGASQQLWQTAARLEGLPRHTSTHAAGVVIAPCPLTDLVPLQPGGEGIFVTQYAMEDLEQLGFIKMDFLGLRTLTLIDATVAAVQQNTGAAVDWRRISKLDSETFSMLAKGETGGCFQLESSGVRRVLRDLRPTGLEDLIAVISLYRPGPMENIPDFIAAKHGRIPVRYPHPDLAPILADTYGVLVYQEQIMQIAAHMAGFSLGQADLLRRAVGKKKRELLDAKREQFVSGCREKGYDDETAQGVYDLIVRFANYGFNRSHAAAYAVLAFRTAYLRAHHLPEFLATLLSLATGDEKKTAEYVRDARMHGIEVRPPSIQYSHIGYRVEEPGVIRIGLLSVRNVGRGAVEAILAARADGPFHSLVDFLQRINPRTCNRKVVEGLLAVGALADFLPQRLSPKAAAQVLMEAYVQAQAGGLVGGLGLELASPLFFVRYTQAEGQSQVLRQIQQVLRTNPGSVRVALYEQNRRRLRLLPNRWSVNPSPELVSVLEEIVGMGNAKLGTMPAGENGPLATE